MIDNIVLFLMQVKGLSRRTIYNYFYLEDKEYTIKDIQDIIKQAALDTKKIDVPSMQELETVYDRYNTILENSNKLGIKIISYLDPDFPNKLRKIADPPAVIYALGNIDCLDEKAIAIIGTREPIEYGEKIAKSLGYVHSEKSDEMSKKVYHVFKKDWDTYLPDIRKDLFEAVKTYFGQGTIKNSNIAVAIMPSHLKNTYGQNLHRLACDLCRKFGFWDATDLIQRSIDKVKSTAGGERTIWAHLETLGLGYEINKNVNTHVVLDDITTTGSSLEAAKELLIRNGVESRNIIKIAIAKTMHDDSLLFG